MATSGVSYLDKIVTTTPNMTIQSLSSGSLNANIQSLVERGSGEILPNFISTQSQKPTIEFTTPEIDQVLTACGHTGTSIATGTFWIKAGATAGRVARATASHERIACTTGLMYWDRIRLPHNGKGEIDARIITVWDGTNAPFIRTGSSALSGTVSATNYYRCGPAKINNTAIGALQEITINNNVQIEEVSSDGDVLTSFASVKTCETVIEVRTLNMINWGTSITYDGIPLDGTNGFVCWARKFSADNQMVANATAEHISLTILQGRIVPLDTQGQGSEILSDRFRVEGRAWVDGSNVLRFLDIDTTAAIA